jgi:peptide chain release factor 1
MPDPIQSLLDEHAELQRQLADPAVHAEQGKARRLGRRYAELNGIVEAHGRVRRLEDDLGSRNRSARPARSCAGCSSRATPTTDAT